MGEFPNEIREQAWEKSQLLKIVCSGGRAETYQKFIQEQRNASDAIVMLLVDAESAVDALHGHHLLAEDGRNLNQVNWDLVHLMVQIMETWLVADLADLTLYCGKKFSSNALPNHCNLEEVGETDIENAVKGATKRTQKG